jgi:hypothetical protein
MMTTNQRNENDSKATRRAHLAEHRAERERHAAERAAQLEKRRRIARKLAAGAYDLKPEERAALGCRRPLWWGAA